MECLSLICGIVPCLWDCSAKHAAYLNDFKANLASLRAAMDELNNLRQDVRNRVREAEEQQMRPSDEERVVLLFNKLKEKKFVVLLDDLWERLELSEVGIPQPCVVKMSKIVFTTRSSDICQSMDAHKLVKVGCLPPDQALNLFCSKVGDDVLKSHPELKELVKDVASECKGLPLALITIGRSMKDKTSAQQWKDTKRMLRMYPSSFPGMEGRVFAKLVFSYDSLPTPTLQKCFEYCSMFREDQSIEEDELIKIWIAEGLLNEYDSVYDALIQGRQIIERLKQACLLEVGEWDGYVKMHDVIWSGSK